MENERQDEESTLFDGKKYTNNSFLYKKFESRKINKYYFLSLIVYGFSYSI